jgi:hypothetical protein
MEGTVMGTYLLISLFISWSFFTVFVVREARSVDNSEDLTTLLMGGTLFALGLFLLWPLGVIAVLIVTFARGANQRRRFL